MSSTFDYIQTFYIDKDAVNQASEIMLTSIDVFFKGKPSIDSNINGVSKPGISYWICEVVNNQPAPSTIMRDSVSRVEYDYINSSSDASIATALTFRNPVVLQSGKYYGVVLKLDDPAFIIWINRQGGTLLGSSRISPGSQSRFDGKLYQITNSDSFREYNDRDLKFRVNIARFLESNGYITLVNKPYEFFTVDTIVGSFIGGEYVYANTANATGTLSVSSSSANITGNSTAFDSLTEGRNLIISNGSVTDVLKIISVTNTTFMQVDRYPSFSNTAIGYKTPLTGVVYFSDLPNGSLTLVDSTASNSTFKFAANDKIYGTRSGASANVVSIDKLAIDQFVPKLRITNPPASTYDLSYKLTTADDNINSTYDSMQINMPEILGNSSFILSRSLEVEESGLFGDNRRSAVINVAFEVDSSTTNLFAVPYLDGDQLDFYTYTNDINDDYLATRFGITDYDTEIDRNGDAKSKYISKKITFASGKYAEDLRVFVTAYRPANTEIRVYAKIHNAADRDAFDDKSWSPLEIKDNVENYSSLSDFNSLIEYTYGFPQYPEVKESLTTIATVASGNSVVLTSTDVSTNVTSGSIVRVYNPLVTRNHEVFTVLSSNSTSFTVNKQITNVNIVGSMSVDVLKYPTVAFNNIANDNVCRYYTTSQQEFDMFTSMQVKVVLLSNSSFVAPRIDKLEVIGVSA